MTKQELLEQLIGCLPYDLQVRVKIKGKYQTITAKYYHLWEYITKNIDAKPIMRPLSDLHKPCLEGGKVPIDCINDELLEINGSANFDYLGYKGSCHRFRYYKEEPAQFALPYFIVKMMHKWHFWLGDQSEFGRSIIDINTLNK